MAWSYNPLWKLLIDKKMKKTDLIPMAGLNPKTLARMGKDEDVSMETLNKLCNVLHCKIEDIVEFVPDDNQE